MLINNLQFQGPYFYDRPFNSTFACVYVIVDNQKLIYAGITDNINERLSGHHKLNCWKRNTSNSEKLYFYKESIQLNRERIEREIINRYNPVCNNN